MSSVDRKTGESLQTEERRTQPLYVLGPNLPVGQPQSHLATRPWDFSSSCTEHLSGSQFL